MSAFMGDEPLFSGRRLAVTFQIAFLGACALAGVRVVLPDASLTWDIVFRIVCVAGAVGNTWWLYRGRAAPGKPWLTEQQADTTGRWVDIASVAVAVVAIIALVAIIIVSWPG